MQNYFKRCIGKKLADDLFSYLALVLSVVSFASRASAANSPSTVVAFVEAGCPCGSMPNLCLKEVDYKISILDWMTKTVIWGPEIHGVVVDNSCRFFAILGRTVPISTDILQRANHELGLLVEHLGVSEMIPFYGATGKATGNGPKGPSCSVSGTTIICEDGYQSGLQGPKGNKGPVGKRGQAGKNGSQGEPGEPGKGCSIAGTVISCENGATIDVRGKTGAVGEHGVKGEKGEPGTRGKGCSVAGTIVQCEDGSSQDVKGEAGDKGPKGKNGSSGPRGAPGGECFVNNGLVTCEDGSSGLVLGDIGPEGPKGTTGGDGPKGSAGRGCSVQGALVACEDGSSGDVKGNMGSKGDTGPQGRGCQVEFDGSTEMATVVCYDYVNMTRSGNLLGERGPQGDNGPRGPIGDSGEGCAVAKVDGSNDSFNINCLLDNSSSEIQCKCDEGPALCAVGTNPDVGVQPSIISKKNDIAAIQVANYHSRPIQRINLPIAQLGSEPEVWHAVAQLGDGFGEILMIYGSVLTSKHGLVMVGSSSAIHLRVVNRRVEAMFAAKDFAGLPLLMQVEYIALN